MVLRYNKEDLIYYLQSMKNIIASIPKNINKEIEYQDEAIISKVLLQDEKLNLTLFAVASGQEFLPHTSGKNAIVHITEGQGQFMLGEIWYDFFDNDYFYMPAGTLHAIKAKGNFKFLLYLF